MSLSCNVAMDLVGAYKDGAVSKLTAEQINRHLSECPACRKYYKTFDRIGKRSPKIVFEDDRRFEKRFDEISRRLHKKHTIKLSAASVIIGALGVIAAYETLKRKNII